ncbi:hypothetical protein AB0N16_28595 [Streptomyces sp. NPDC051105]|uniref:hypothetical protein n=1 Tax=Streptomyces sp. NPDC051105 TaxID=3154843 RepID=UPI003433D3C4
MRMPPGYGVGGGSGPAQGEQDDPTLSGIRVSGSGNHGKAATVCAVTAACEDTWLDPHHSLDPNMIEGAFDLHALILDDIDRLRMRWADDLCALGLSRSLMSFQVTAGIHRPDTSPKNSSAD